MDIGRNTWQKQLIIDTLKREKNHPTISDLYDKIKAVDDKVGQATVYRNVNKLVEEKKIKRIMTDSGFRYDCDCNDHYHLECNKCGNIIDLYDEKYIRLIRRLEDEYSIKIEESKILFSGICDKCLNYERKSSSIN